MIEEGKDENEYIQHGETSMEVVKQEKQDEADKEDIKTGSYRRESTMVAACKDSGAENIIIPDGFPKQLDTRVLPYTIKIWKDKVTARYIGAGNHSEDHGSVRTDLHVPMAESVYYFEVCIKNAGKKGNIAIGFSTAEFDLSKQVGTHARSWGYRCDNGQKYACGSKVTLMDKSTHTPLKANDVIGCGFNAHTMSIFYTRNGCFIENALQVVGFSVSFLFRQCFWYSSLRGDVPQ